MKASLKSLINKSKKQQSLLNELRIADEEEEKHSAEYKEIRSTKQKRIVNDDIYFTNFSPNDCNFCMHYDDETDGCKKGISFEQWDEMNRNGNDCEFWDYIYEIENQDL